MEKKPKKNYRRNIKVLPTLEWIPVEESKIDFQKRKEQVQELLVFMFMRLRKRGRPKKNEEPESYAA